MICLKYCYKATILQKVCILNISFLTVNILLNLLYSYFDCFTSSVLFKVQLRNVNVIKTVRILILYISSFCLLRTITAIHEDILMTRSEQLVALRYETLRSRCLKIDEINANKI